MSEQFTFKAEIRQLLNILVHSLYTDRDIFLREVISNASDALNRVAFEALTRGDAILDADAEHYIEIAADDAAGTLTISDSGIGMTRDDLVENLGVIAHSGAKGFVEALKARADTGATANELIGQFGVGFYSVFMVADHVRVVSRSLDPEGSAWAWEATGDEGYTITPAERENRGTDIILTLKEDAKEYLQPWKLREIIRKHSNYIAFPIYLAGDEEPINERNAIWRQDPKEVSDEKYNDFFKMLTFEFQDPLHRIHMRADVPLQFYAILYVPPTAEQLLTRREPGLRLYARKVLIQERTTDLLPDYLSFVQGVVDSEDLPLAVSRESVQATRMMAQLKKTLTNKVLTDLKRLLSTDRERYEMIWANFGRLIKQGVMISPADREGIEPLLLFPSTVSTDEQDWFTLGDYVDRMKPEQSEIYYVVADDYAAASRSPHLDAFRKRGIEVLYFCDPIDPVMIMGLPDHAGKKLRSVDDADIDLSAFGDDPAQADETPAADALATDDFEAVRARFAERLGDRVVEVRESKTLVNSPARLVSKDNNPARNMFRLNRLMDRDYELPVKILELNPRHPLIHNLRARLGVDAGDSLVDAVVEQVFEIALLQDGIHPDPASMADRLFLIMQAATKPD